MPNWKHKLTIKHFFMDFEGAPTAAETTEMAQNVIATIKLLVSRLGDEDPLKYDLEGIIEEFETIDSSDSDEDAEDQFNFALDRLYDEGNYNHRVWVG